MIALQSPILPRSVLHAILAAAPADTTEYRIATAYVTRDGARLLVEQLRAVITRWASIPKIIITCFDFGTTDPDALEHLQNEGFEVRIANVESDLATSSGSSSYHPKVYAATVGADVHLVVGSANLTRRALTVNTEVVTTHLSTDADFTVHWAHLVENSVPLSEGVLDDYKQKRPKRRSRPMPSEPPVPVPLPASNELPVFRDRVRDGSVNPDDYQNFWVEVGGPSGGAGNQLELPRLGHRFFGHEFNHYELAQADIAELTIHHGGRRWADRKLTWHGNNKMERINLPTTLASGLTYSHKVVLFHRSGEGFELSVADPGSESAVSWQEESAASGVIFRFGPNSDRLCGLF